MTTSHRMSDLSPKLNSWKKIRDIGQTICKKHFFRCIIRGDLSKSRCVNLPDNMTLPINVYEVVKSLISS